MTSSVVIKNFRVSAASRGAESVLSYKRKVKLAQTAFVVSLIALAELASRLSGMSHELFPPPSVVFVNVFTILQQPEIRFAVWTLLGQLLLSFVLSTVLGIIVGYLVGAWLAVEKVTLPILLLIYSVPQVTVLPLFVLYFGPGFGSKVAFGVSHGMFPIALSVVAGLNHARANPVYARWARTLGATPVQRLIRVQLPQAIGSILVGLRLSISTALLGVLLADIYVSTHGVGFYTRLFTETLQGPKLFALITLLALLAIGINLAVSWLERHTSRWKT